MLTERENDRLAKVSRGTAGGELMRRYWHPIAPMAMLDENPVRQVTILGEELVLYKDRSGTLGLVGPRCAHRLVHLRFGIPEEKGLRCPYHGWCYDETGQCIDTPLESPHSHLKDSVRIPGYPVREPGGLVWGYLGPEPAPVLPPWDFLVWPNSLRQIAITIIPCNRLQCHENSADPLHTIYLHGHFFKYVLEQEGLTEERKVDSPAHRVQREISRQVGSDHIIFERDPKGFRKGVHFSVERGAKEEHDAWHQYNVFPYYSCGGGGFRSQVNIRVPMDDTHTYHINYTVFHAPGVEAPKQDSIPYFYPPTIDEDGKPILDYVLAQDMAAWSAQGPLTDRSRETLGATDLAIIEFRKIIEEQIAAVESGRDPMNVFRNPEEVGDCIYLEPAIGSKVSVGLGRELLHEGYINDDADRYGPLTELVKELSRRAAEVRRESAAVGAAKQ